MTQCPGNEWHQQMRACGLCGKGCEDVGLEQKPHVIYYIIFDAQPFINSVVELPLLWYDFIPFALLEEECIVLRSHVFYVLSIEHLKFDHVS